VLKVHAKLLKKEISTNTTTTTIVPPNRPTYSCSRPFLTEAKNGHSVRAFAKNKNTMKCREQKAPSSKQPNDTNNPFTFSVESLAAADG